MALPDILSDWISIKGAIINYSLWDETMLSLLPYLCKLQKRQVLNVEQLLVVIARLVALSPHNMYVEQCISAYDMIKSEDRSSLKRDTLNDYMIVKMNMPPVATYDMKIPVLKYLNHKKRKPQKDFSNGEKFKQQEYFVNNKSTLLDFLWKQLMIPAYKTSFVMHTFEKF